MDLKLKNKVIIVTGGSKGIGYGITMSLFNEGCIPVIISRNKESVMSVVEEIQNLGGEIYYALAELTDPDQCKKAVAEVVKKYGRIDGVVNNAGVNDGVGLEHGSYEGFIQSLHRNLVHYYLIAHHALPELKKSKGAIVK